MISEVIRPRPIQAPVAVESAPANGREWVKADDTKVIFPKRPDGKSCRVVIVRRSVTLMIPGRSKQTVFHACRNAGKWSYRVERAIGGLTRYTFEELRKQAVAVGMPAGLVDWLSSPAA